MRVPEVPSHDRAERVPYHHGDLRNALLEAATELAAAGGPAAVQLRDAARRVGVSHNAGYRHFANRDALLDAVAERGFTALSAAMREAMSQVPVDLPAAERARERVKAAGRGYLSFALASPGLFRTAFAVRERPDQVTDLHGSHAQGQDAQGQDAQGQDAQGQDANAYLLLVGAVDDLVRSGALPPERRPGAELVAWSAVHGLATLLLDGPLQTFSADERSAVLERLLETVDAGL